MSDRSRATITIYDCPQSKQRAVVDLLNENGFAEEWLSDQEVSSPLRLGEEYVAGEVSVGSCGEIGPELATLGATFELWQDPVYEWDGDIYIHVPSLGSFQGSCDANGTIHVSVAEVDRILDEVDSLESATAALHDATGKRFRDVVRAMAAGRRPA